MVGRPVRSAARSVTYRQVLGLREFRYVLVGHTLSQLGDQALRVALALLVYHDSASPLLTAIAYALTFLPWVVGGPLLSGLTDRLPRRTVLVYGDLARAAIVALMTIPYISVSALLVLVFLAEMIAPPAEAARSALMPELLEGDSYIVGSSLTQAGIQASQIIGFGAGGALVASIGARGALGLDVASFVVSAVLVRIGLGHRYLPPLAGKPTGSFWADTREGIAAALGRAAPRNLLLISWWAGAVLLVPEALAAPFVARVAHGGSTETGWLLAAQPTGMIIGLVLLARTVPPGLRRKLTRPLAVASALPLLGFAARPAFPVAIVLLLCSGLCWSFQVALQALFVDVIAAEVRGRAFAIAASGSQIAQGLGVVAGGVLAEIIGVSPAIAAAGAVGAVVTLLLASRRTSGGSELPAAPVAQPTAVT